MSHHRALRTVAAIILAGLFTLTACGSSKQPVSARDTAPTTVAADASPATTSPATTKGTCTYTEDGMPTSKKVTLPPAEPTESGEVPAVLKTNSGDIHVTLDAANAPCTVNSFVSLVQQGYYHDNICHRLTTQGIYVLQCGDPTATGMGGPGYQYPDELKGTETYGPGTLAMANAGPNTNGSQFFLVYGDSPLDPAYTVFGHVDKAGVKILKQIAKKGTDTGAGDGKPAKEVRIDDVKLG